jgi:hypothetical protein
MTKLTTTLMIATLATAAFSLPAKAQDWNGYYDQQQSYDQSMQSWSNMMLGQQEYQDSYGNSYWGNPYATSNWVDNSGTLYQMDGYTPPDYSSNYTEVTPAE